MTFVISSPSVHAFFHFTMSGNEIILAGAVVSERIKHSGPPPLVTDLASTARDDP